MYHSYLQQCKSEYTVIINYTTQTHNSVGKLSGSKFFEYILIIRKIHNAFLPLFCSWLCCFLVSTSICFAASACNTLVINKILEFQLVLTIFRFDRHSS